MNTNAPDEEFGVPFPGAIVSKEHWTETSYRLQPAAGMLDWCHLFGNSKPIVLDLGCGNGRFLIGRAIVQPDWNHFGLDNLPLVVRYAVRRGNQRGLTNVRFAVGDAAQFVRWYVADASVREAHIYHPQPYFEVADLHRRLITPGFLVQLHRILQPSGQLVLQTDNPGYWRYMKQIAEYLFIIEERFEPWPDAPVGRTRREIVARQQKLRIFRGIGTPRESVDRIALQRQAELLPPPLFDADRRR
jgi:tRNA (guanine-N7-)-methyltransferase